jgi:hypothetical protein
MSEEIEAILVDLQLKIDRLRILYEQYFIGIEKAEPSVPRKEIVRIFAELQHAQIRNTALRFRHNALMQRWNTYVMRWGRTLREIELGVYNRHVARAQRKGVLVPDEIVNRKPGASARSKSNPEALAAAHQTLQGVLKAARDTQTLPPTRTEPVPSVEDQDLLDRDTLDGLLAEVDDGKDFIFESTPRPKHIVVGPPRDAKSLSAMLPPPREGAQAKPPAEAPVAKTPAPTVARAGQDPSKLQAVRPQTRNTPAPVGEPPTRPGNIITPPPFPVTGQRTPTGAPPSRPGNVITPPPFPVAGERPRSVTPPPIAGDAPRAPKPPLPPIRERSVTPPPFPVDAPRAPKPAAPPPPAFRDVIPGMNEGEMRALHKRYAAARKSTDGADVSYDAMVASLKKQVPVLLDKHKCAGLNFDLTVRDNQVILKAKPKK